MNQFARLLLSVATCVALFGCAHPISMTTESSTVSGNGTAMINKKVGYDLPPQAVAGQSLNVAHV